MDGNCPRVDPVDRICAENVVVNAVTYAGLGSRLCWIEPRYTRLIVDVGRVGLQERWKKIAADELICGVYDSNCT